MLVGRISLLLSGMTFIASPADAADEPVVSYGPSDADSIVLLAGSFHVNPHMAGSLPFWWDHTNLTVAVQSAPTTDAGDVEAARNAIALWSEVLQDWLLEISLTDITATNRTANRADIVIHLVPTPAAWHGEVAQRAEVRSVSTCWSSRTCRPATSTPESWTSSTSTRCESSAKRCTNSATR